MNTLEKSSNILKINNITEVQQLLKDKSHVVLVFTAEWLGSSHIMELFIKDFMIDYKNDVVFCKIEKGENSNSIFEAYGVQHLPSLIFIQNGVVLNQINGVKGRKVIRESLEGFIKKGDTSSM